LAPDTVDVHALDGLTASEAAARLARDGPNELPAARRRGFVRLVWEVLAEPMIGLLVAVGVVYLLLGDREQAILLLASIGVVVAIDLVQQRRSERALEALRDLSSPRALVIRDRQIVRIPGREVVRDDLIVLAEGDRVPADGDCLWTQNASIDESLLTGESVAVRKRVGGPAPLRPGGEDTARVYSGTLVVQGQAVARVLATGAATELGRIGRSLETLPIEATPLQRQVDTLVRIVGVAAFGVCVLAALTYGATRGDWLQGALVGLTLAVSLVPEEFPLVLTIFFALGAWRLARARVLTRRIPAIEALGAATVLCVDKTGTLTENRMTVRTLWTPDVACELAEEPARVPDALHELVEFAILASHRDPFDPMERAIVGLGATALAGTEHLHADWRLEREYPLSPELLAISLVWSAPDAERCLVAAKGAPEAIVDLCHLGADAAAGIADAVERMAGDGLRVLGVARAAFRHPLPSEQHAFDFRFLGLVALADPLRATVPAALADCATAGIRVVMLTGDYPATARAIARRAGLPHADDVVTGAEIDALDDDALAARVASLHVFARMVPEQKLRLVQALRRNGDVVAMTGDGVNDAPALRAAHIGIAMGGRGTDVAREAAALVLVDDDFASIVGAVRMGRRIHANLRQAIVFIVAVHVAIAGVALLPVLLLWPLVLLPIHVVFLELLIDPACSIAFEAEPEEPMVMRRPPRPRGAPLLQRAGLVASVAQGAGALAIVLAAFVYGLGQGELVGRALAFTALVGAILGMILVNRTERAPLARMFSTRNRALSGVVAGAVALLAIVLGVPAAREVFRVATLPWPIALGCLVAGVASVLWLEMAKTLGRLRERNRCIDATH
jgi:Ca2+-transporting ATPase